MSRNPLYAELVQGLCSLADVDSPADVLENGQLLVDGVAFTLIHDSLLDIDTIMIGCDFGPTLIEKEGDTYRYLLELNLFICKSKRPCTFARNPETGHILFIDFAQLPELTPESLLDTLHHTAQLALGWRETGVVDTARFFPNPPQTRTTH